MTEHIEINDELHPSIEPTELQPLSFYDVLEYWVDTKNVDVAFFRREKQRANSKTTNITLAVFTITMSLLMTINSLISCMTGSDNPNCFTTPILPITFFMGIIGIPLMYYGVHYFLYVLGGAFSEKAIFKEQLYLGIFITLPINLVIYIARLFFSVSPMGFLYLAILYTLKLFSYSLMYKMLKELNGFSSQKMVKYTITFLGIVVFLYVSLSLIILPPNKFSLEVISTYFTRLIHIILLF